MDLVREFRWTTRAGVCEQLLWIALQADPPAGEPEGEWMYREIVPGRAVDLLLKFADRSCWERVAPLAPLLRNAWHVGWQHRYLELKPEVTADDVANLRSTFRDPLGKFAAHSVSGVLALSPPDGEWRAARTLLEEMEPRERAEALLGCYTSGRSRLLAPGLVDWLYYQWLRHDRGVVGDVMHARLPLNFLITRETRRRPESRALLIEAWPRLTEAERIRLIEWLTRLCELLSPRWSGAPPADEERLREWAVGAKEDEKLLEECLATDPALRQELIERLALPLPHLLRQVGPDALLDLIETKIRAYSRSQETGQLSSADHEALWKGLRHLESLPGDRVDALLGLICLRPELHDLHAMLRGILWRRRWWHARSAALSMAQTAAGQGNEEWAAEAVHRLHSLVVEEGGTPQPEDRGFLLWASQYRRAMFRYVGAVGLERLGEDSPEWRERLAALARDRRPAVRLVAWEALARRGDESFLPRIVRMATRSRQVLLRAEALYALGKLDAGRHLAVLIHALLTDRAELEYQMPAAAAAAQAIRSLGTPEALTLLVRTALAAPLALWGALQECLTRTDPFAPLPQSEAGRLIPSRRSYAHVRWLRLLDGSSASSNGRMRRFLRSWPWRLT